MEGVLLLTLLPALTAGSTSLPAPAAAAAARDETEPLLTVMETRPHSLSLMVAPRHYRPDTMVRLLYERVPVHRQPLLQHLDDPVLYNGQ